MLARGDTAEALIVLGKLAPTPEVERLQAAARVTAGRSDDLEPLQRTVDEDSSNQEARLALASALAARGEYEPALDHLLFVVRMKADLKEDARKAMLDIFGVLGDEHPLTGSYRRQLASALF